MMYVVLQHPSSARLYIGNIKAYFFIDYYFHSIIAAAAVGAQAILAVKYWQGFSNSACEGKFRLHKEKQLCKDTMFYSL